MLKYLKDYNVKYLRSIIDNSVVVCDEIINAVAKS